MTVTRNKNSKQRYLARISHMISIMAAEIKPATGTGQGGNVRKPTLINKIEGMGDEINMVVVIPREDGVITVSDDRTVRVWLKRDTGQFWPSICHSMPSAASCIDYRHEVRKLFIGTDSGTIAEFELADDYNKMTSLRSYLAHQSRVTAIKFCITNEWLLSCGRDKYFQWHCYQTGRRLGGYQANAWCTSLEFDTQSRYVFVGDYSGQISVLKISESSFEVITTLKGHSGSVRSLSWDDERSWLFSGSFDKSVIVWDIGGRRGTAYELQGHHDKVECVLFARISKQLLSAGDDSILAFWDMDVKRQETPEWLESDTCQKCSVPFFWNVKTMWEQRTVGVRQHHCRKCGQAICAKCSQGRTTIPVMGYEYEVRVCDNCNEVVSGDDSRAPLATFHDLKHQIVHMSLDEQRKLLVTAGKDKLVKFWDVSNVLH